MTKYLPLLLLLSLVGCENSNKPIEFVGTVRNSNIVYYKTLIAIEPDNDLTPFKLTICGWHPEIWKGEHVRMTVQLSADRDGECWDIIQMQRIGADR